MIRGTLLEAIPGDHATVQLATGQSAFIPWDRVERIERAGAPSAPPPPPRVPPIAPSASAPRPPEPTALVHIESDAPVVLEHRNGGRMWSRSCSSPCDADLPLTGEYRISGSGVRSSAPFPIAARPGEHVVLQVNTASRGGFVGGIVLVATGPIVALIGALVLLVEAEQESIAQTLGNAPPDGSAKTVGWVMVAGGGAMALGGILLMTGNSHSHVEQMTARPRSDAWLRLPTFHEDPTAAGLPKAVGVPFFQTTF